MRDVEGRTDAMVATLRIRQLQKDVQHAEDAELRRLEDGSTAGGDGDGPDVPETGGGASGGPSSSNAVQDGGAGVVVVVAKQRAEQLDGKKFVNGGFCDRHKVTCLQPFREGRTSHAYLENVSSRY